MSLFDSYRQRRVGHTGRESIATLEAMRAFFQGGQHWVQGVYHGPDGKCLVGAADHARVSSVDDAKYWLHQAIAEVAPGYTTIEGFNDTRSSYLEIAAVLARAEQLATAQLPAPMPVRALPAPVPPVVEILPPLPREAPRISSGTNNLMQRARARLETWRD